MLCGVVGFIIGDVFVGVFDMAIESLFVCFAEDIEQNVDKVGREIRTLFLAAPHRFALN